MKFEETVTSALVGYPMLFYFSTWKRSRQALLDHMFIVNGNGYAWDENGEMICEGKEIPEVILTEENHKEILEALPLEEPSEIELEFWEKFFKDSRPRPVARHKFAYHFENRKSFPTKEYKTYGLCRYSKLLTIPDNIETSWLEGAKEMVVYLKALPKNDDDVNNDDITRIENRINEIEELRK